MIRLHIFTFKTSNMKYLYFLLITLSVVSCKNGMRGSGNMIRETRQVSEISSASVSGPIKVDVKIGLIPSLIIEADDNIMPFVVTNVSDNNLNIKLKGINILINATINIHLIIPAITKLTTSASAEIRTSEIITNTEKVTFVASSGSLINVNVDAPVIFADASSGADIILAGRTKNLTAQSSSGSKVNLIALQAENVSASASSGAEITVFASVGINANASSGGNVKYKGGAASVVKNVSSGGSVSAE